jgi:sporulation protein YlmC with PRC-barrel domain
MDKSKSIKRWSELSGLPVVTGGRRLGTVDDFYLEPETNAVRALRINTGVYGYRLLQSSAIGTIGQSEITIDNEYMLAEEKTDGRLTALIRGKNLLSYKIVNEQGTTIGKVANVLIDTGIPVALRVVAFELIGGSRPGRAPRSLSASKVTGYQQDIVVVFDK